MAFRLPGKLIELTVEEGDTVTKGMTLAAATSQEAAGGQAAVANSKLALSQAVGKLVAERAKAQGITQVVFDRGGYKYHGRIKALAEGSREAGLSF